MITYPRIWIAAHGGNLKVAQYKDTPPEILRLLAATAGTGDEAKVVRLMIAGNPNAPADVLRQLARNEDHEVRRFVGVNDNTPVDSLRELATDEDTEVRSIVAAHRSTPPEVLDRLGRDHYLLVRDNVAANPNTPIGTLRLLAMSDSLTRDTVAKNPAVTSKRFEEWRMRRHRVTDGGP